MENEYFIFYVQFEDKIMPIYCNEIKVDPILEGHTLFMGIKHLDDSSFPKLKIKQISLPSADIKYYLKGIELEEVDVLSEPTEKEKEEIEEKISKKPDASPEKSNIFARRRKPRKRFTDK